MGSKKGEGQHKKHKISFELAATIFRAAKQLSVSQGSIIRGKNKMKKECDFSKGARGKFYRPNLKLNLPIYLEPEIMAFVEGIAQKRNSNLSAVVNALIKTDKQLAEVIK